MSAIEVEAEALDPPGAGGSWVWQLVGGIVSVVFGFFVLSYHHVSLYALVYLAGAYFLAFGVYRLVGVVMTHGARFVVVAAGVASVGAGIAAFVWPQITLYVTAVLIGWVLLAWGITDLVHAVGNRARNWWWLGLVQGLVVLALGVWALRHPGDALVVLVVVLGLWAIVNGVVEILGAAAAKGASS
jgi:uncharacterized membrane protein HdeD (DUF308 family)